MKKAALGAALIVAAVPAAAAIFVYAGLYNIAADEPHWAVTERLLAAVRVRSIEMRSRDIRVPDLENEKLVLRGAGQYAEMCAGCHLSPGESDSPLRQGLYPQPPELARHKMDPRSAFWVIKHGIKLTGMPAWGASHDDETLWSLVAFLNGLPALDPQQYRAMIERAPPDTEMVQKPAKGHGGGAHGGKAPAPKKGAH